MRFNYFLFIYSLKCGSTELIEIYIFFKFYLQWIYFRMFEICTHHWIIQLFANSIDIHNTLVQNTFKWILRINTHTSLCTSLNSLYFKNVYTDTTYTKKKHNQRTSLLHNHHQMYRSSSSCGCCCWFTHIACWSSSSSSLSSSSTNINRVRQCFFPSVYIYIN